MDGLPWNLNVIIFLPPSPSELTWTLLIPFTFHLNSSCRNPCVCVCVSVRWMRWGLGQLGISVKR